jgi:hypothetical protein
MGMGMGMTSGTLGYTHTDAYVGLPQESWDSQSYLWDSHIVVGVACIQVGVLFHLNG